MCYLKKFQTIQPLPEPKTFMIDETDNFSSDESSFLENPISQHFSISQKEKAYSSDNSNNLVMDLLSLLNQNSYDMNLLEKKIDQNSALLDQIDDQFQDSEQIKIDSSAEDRQTVEASSNSEQISAQPSSEKLTETLFGKNNYKYKLELVEPLEPVIYKQRNISFKVNLTDLSGTKLRNSNIINLCLGVCQTNGTWITHAKTGQDILKGKTQTELYHGQGSYEKIYPRDVSRHFQDGKVVFVIYPKPSLLHYAEGSNSLESSIDSSQIEPLLIKDLTIRAKRKN